jgi:hypothetical protein
VLISAVGRHDVRPVSQGADDIHPGRACAVPCGFSGERLPIGLQITGPADSQATVLRLARG